MAERDTPQKPSRLWRTVLVLSLALNLVVAGVVAGTVLSGRVGDGPPRSFDLGAGPVTRALSPSERREVGRALRQARVLRDLNPRGRAADMVAVLLADPFDPEALRAMMAEQSTDLVRVQSQVQEVLVEMISGMTPERRAEFAAAVAAELERGRDQRLRPSGG